MQFKYIFSLLISNLWYLNLQGMGQKIPPGLLVCRSSVLELSDRLQQYAAVSCA